MVAPLAVQPLVAQALGVPAHIDLGLQLRAHGGEIGVFGQNVQCERVRHEVEQLRRVHRTHDQRVLTAPPGGNGTTSVTGVTG